MHVSRWSNWEEQRRTITKLSRLEPWTSGAHIRCHDCARFIPGPVTAGSRMVTQSVLETMANTNALTEDRNPATITEARAKCPSWNDLTTITTFLLFIFFFLFVLIFHSYVSSSSSLPNPYLIFRHILLLHKFILVRFQLLLYMSSSSLVCLRQLLFLFPSLPPPFSSASSFTYYSSSFFFSSVPLTLPTFFFSVPTCRIGRSGMKWLSRLFLQFHAAVYTTSTKCYHPAYLWDTEKFHQFCSCRKLNQFCLLHYVRTTHNLKTSFDF